MKTYIHNFDSYPLVRFWQDAILNVLPVGNEYTHGVFAFFSTIYGLKGAVETSVSGASCIHSYGQQATQLSLFALYSCRSKKAMTNNNQDKKKIAPWLYFLGIAFPIILILKGLEGFFPFITTEWFFAVLFIIFFITIGRK